MTNLSFRSKDLIESITNRSDLPHIVIAVDGPAASGKGTLSRALARRLGCAHMDTGALYRAVGHEVLLAGHDPAQEGQAVQAAQQLGAKILKALEAGSGLDVILGHEALRNDDVANAASVVAAMPQVRDALRDIQRDFAKKPGEGWHGSILDGRDIGTVICPDAHVKLYITAQDEIRAKRRMKELQSKGIQVTYEAVLAQMRERDKRDSERESSPLKPAEDAYVLDTSHLSESEMLDQALSFIRARLASTFSRTL